jgi:hypothetical protein
MNKKIIASIAFLILIVVSILATTFTFAQTKSNGFEILTAKVIADKDSYVKGEPVNLRIEIVNKGDTDVSFVQPHESRLLIDKDAESYKSHNGEPTDCSTRDFLVLKPNQSWKMDFMPFLWNGKPDYSHFAGNTKTMEDFDKQTRVVTEYVFQNTGTYNATIRLKFRDSKNRNETKIEAEPAKVNIKEPEGEDLEVWKQIEGKIDIALLMQRGNFSGRADEAKQSAITREVEQIIINHPNSTYTKYLKSGIEKFKANTEKLKQPE